MRSGDTFREDTVTDRRLERILRTAAAPGILTALGDRLSPTDLQTLLLEVYRRRAARVTPSRLLEQYERNRFTAPSALDPAELTRLDLLFQERLAAYGFEVLALSPVCPLGTNSAVATVDQHKVLTTVRGTEVVADATNVLALECAARRRGLPRGTRTRTRLAASHRVLRTQMFSGLGMSAHFQLLALVTAGRDEGSFAFETTALAEQVGAHLDILGRSRRVRTLNVTVTDLTGGRHRDALGAVMRRLAAEHPEAAFGFDDERAHGRGYYVGACFEIGAVTAGGDSLGLVDGGFTRWTAELLGNAKERLLISGLGVERLCGHFPAGDGRVSGPTGG
jgi:hypothetical protein